MTTTTIGEVQKHLKKLEYCVIDKQAGLVVVYDKRANLQHGEERIKRLYRINELDPQLLEEVDVEQAIEELAELLSSKVNTKEILMEILKTSNAESIIGALHTLREGKAKVEKEKGCLAFSISDDKGRNVGYFAIGSKA